MVPPAHSFEDSEGYERLIGRWSRAAGGLFLDWLAPPSGVRWLEVGCGTGVFTELVATRCAPAALTAIDPAQTQIEEARRRLTARGVVLQVADAMQLPFADATFDVVASALVINFISDRKRALAEMCRVSRAGALVAGYVWDFAEDLSPSGPFRRALRRFGATVPELPGTADSRLPALVALFQQARLESITTTSIEVTLSHARFDDFGEAQPTVQSQDACRVTRARRWQHCLCCARERYPRSCAGVKP